MPTIALTTDETQAFLDGRKTQLRRPAHFIQLDPNWNPRFSGASAHKLASGVWVLGSPGGSCWIERTKYLRTPRADEMISAGRLTLRVQSVRIHRLQAIPKQGVVAEGFVERDGVPMAGVVSGWHEPFAQAWDRAVKDPARFAWERDPWVIAMDVTVESVADGVESSSTR